MLPCFVLVLFPCYKPSTKEQCLAERKRGWMSAERAESRHYQEPGKGPVEQWRERGQHASTSSRGQAGDARMEMSGSQPSCPSFLGLQVLPVGPQVSISHPVLESHSLSVSHGRLNSSPATSSLCTYLRLVPDGQKRCLVFLPLLYPHFTCPSRPRSKADATRANATTIASAAASSRKLARPSPAHRKHSPHPLLSPPLIWPLVVTYL